MEVILIIFLLLISLMLWFLIAPLIITIDSNNNRYELRLVSIGFVKVLFENNQFIIHFRILFFERRMNIDPFKKSKAKPKKEEKKKKKKISWSRMKHKMKRVFQSFEIEKCWLNLDTDNYYYNAFLYPIFFFIKGKNYRFNINFQGNNECSLVLKNRLIRLLIAFIF